MTVYGLDYRPKPYEPTGRFRRLSPLVRGEFRALFRGRWGIALYAACFMPVLARLIVLLGYIGLLPFRNPDERLEDLPAMARAWIPIFREFYLELTVSAEQGVFFFVLVMTALATSRAIAKDRATNALELYWTRGISPLGYLFGKWLGAAMLLGTLTVAAPLVLWATGTMLADDWTFFDKTAGFMPRVFLGHVVFTVLLSAACVLVSAIAGSANVATILWCLLLGGSFALSLFLSEMLNKDLRNTISIWDAVATLAREIAGASPPARDVRGAATTLGGLFVLLTLLARRRLRIGEALG